ncbi:MAG TPA: 5-formyltetrahydrofolate cyclo-ligase [Anaerolineae bacterium]|nr:5-formyltetrahydrofolate cyclo-ligase [Anaerolineae bacterium]
MKDELRRHYRELRENLAAEEVEVASTAVCQALAGWAPLQRAQYVLTYLAFRNELDLRCLFELLPGIHWAVPRVDRRDLVLHAYQPDRVIRHRFGMLEPAPDLPGVDAGMLDVVLVPGVAFDRHGGRLGFGGGFYDRFLPTTPALRVGVTYDHCLAASLPMTESDQRMDWVFTPTQQIRCAAPGHPALGR